VAPGVLARAKSCWRALSKFRRIKGQQPAADSSSGIGYQMLDPMTFIPWRRPQFPGQSVRGKNPDEASGLTYWGRGRRGGDSLGLGTSAMEEQECI
jgi:hypothetical protein